MIGVSQGFLSDLGSNRRKPSAQTGAMLVKALDIPSEWIEHQVMLHWFAASSPLVLADPGHGAAGPGGGGGPGAPPPRVWGAPQGGGAGGGAG
ncbi:helix-turn-helix transcriptional regulator, partial [Mesorhizobium sp. M0228]|uniref:helix-turn-helix domain-containing protein n=1 Tax=Mesorhizobium sp. M0228 TaxID=2956923 RepID=UPI003338D991